MYSLVDRPVGTLGRSARFLLWGMRGWADAHGRGACPSIALHRAFVQLNLRPVLSDFHVAMVLLGQGRVSGLALGQIDSPVIVEDEAILLGVWRDIATEGIDQGQRTLALFAGDAMAEPVRRAMGSAVTHLRFAGFDLTQLEAAS